jgi:hypothetical protein
MEAVMSLLLKKKSTSHRRPALKKRRRAPVRLTEVPVRSWAWTPYMEERRQSGHSDVDGRRAVDRAKEAQDDDDTGGPDA